jgi:hypothetical protein
LLEETTENKLVMYHINDFVVPTVNIGVSVTPEKRIQLETVERQTEMHHKVQHMIAYIPEHIIAFQSVFVLGGMVLVFGTQSHNRTRKEVQGIRPRP